MGELAGVSGLDVARAAADRARGRPVWWLRDAETALRRLRGHLREGDLLVTIGAGDIHELASQLVDEQMPAASSTSLPGAGSEEARG